MSYILDALRKSDQQRQRGAAPTLQMAQTAAVAPKRPAYLSYGLLAVVLLGAGMAIGWLRPWQTEPVPPAANVAAASPSVAGMGHPVPARTDIASAPAPAPLPQNATAVAPVASAPAPLSTRTEIASAPAPAPLPQSATAAVPVASAPTPLPARAAAAAPAPVRDPAPAVVAAPVPMPAPAATKSQPPAGAKLESAVKPQEAAAAASKPAAPESPPATASAEPAPAQNVILLADLPLALQQELPPMTISVHAYSARPADRMVGINNRMLREGDYVVPGLKLEQITPEGMVFGYKGYSFRRGVK